MMALKSLPPVRLRDATVDTKIVDGSRIEVITGMLDISTLSSLRIDRSYQREALRGAIKDAMVEAVVEDERFPSLQLGMRGHNWIALDNNVVELLDPVFNVDGQQRADAIRIALLINGVLDVRIGVECWLNSTPEIERRRFHRLNTNRTRVCSTTEIRNMKDDNRSVGTIFGLSHESGFCLFNRVCWDQQFGPDDLITGATFFRVALNINEQPGIRAAHGKSINLVNRGNLLVEEVGLHTFRDNTAQFFRYISGSWSIALSRRKTADHLRAGFLYSLANVLREHRNFWDGRKLIIPSPFRKKLGSFPIQDPAVKQHMGSAGPSAHLQYLLIEHFNYNAREHRLVQRPVVVTKKPKVEKKPKDKGDELSVH